MAHASPWPIGLAGEWAAPAHRAADRHLLLRCEYRQREPPL